MKKVRKEEIGRYFKNPSNIRPNGEKNVWKIISDALLESVTKWINGFVTALCVGGRGGGEQEDCCSLLNLYCQAQLNAFSKCIY